MTMTITRKPTAVIRPGLLKRLKAAHGLRTDAALAGAIGISEATLSRLQNGAEPSIGVVVSISRAFGLGLGEIAIDAECLTQDERRVLRNAA